MSDFPKAIVNNRFNERSFRRYEPILARVVANWPSETVFRPDAHLSANTIIARLRDARVSLRVNQWKSELIDLEKFNRIADSLTFTLYTNGLIRIGPRLFPQAATPKFDVKQAPLDLRAFSLDTSHFELLCYLAQAHALNSLLILNSISDECIASLEAKYDIVITKNPDGSINLL